MAEHDHMCAWNCGNVADNVLVNLNTSEADILCTPCFLRLANDISQAWLKELEKKGLTKPPKPEIADGSTEVSSEVSPEMPSPESSASSTSVSSGDVSSSSLSTTSPTQGDNPPEYEAPEPDRGTGPPVMSEDAQCPICEAWVRHDPGCVFA